jgi:transcriptional regulator with XRE-family HTH domain
MGWNIKQAAEECGISPATWRAWESGRNRITDLSGAAAKIAARTGADYVWLMVGSAVPEAVAGGRAVGEDYTAKAQGGAVSTSRRKYYQSDARTALRRGRLRLIAGSGERHDDQGAAA